MAGSLDLVTSSPEETRALGEALASMLRAGDVVSLTGDLGAGKTTFVQGVGKGLGVTGPVLSPTFTLVREYEGRLPVYHVDVYRLDRLQDVIDLGFEELLDRRGVVVIEWGDAIEGLLPETYLQIELTIPDGDSKRALRVIAFGRAWAGRWDGLLAVAEPWIAERDGERP